MKKIFLSVLMTVSMLSCCGINAYAVETPNISAKSAVVISADTGEIVYSFNADEKLPMASTTKIMTALLCIESGNLDEEFVVDSEAIKVEGSSMGLVEGDIVTKYALCCGMLLPSGNDSANATAVKLAGSIEAFADMMNERAEEIGMSKTHFVTPSGLDGKGHGSSAYDMALLAREALKNEVFREICSQESIQVKFGNPPYDRWLKNTNKLLSMCDGVYGVKTGFTDDAGRCLVSACERDEKELICVTLNDKNDWNDHIALYDYGFGKVKNVEYQINEDIEVSLAGGDTETATLYCPKITDICTVNGSSDVMHHKIKVSPFLYAPLSKDEQCGELTVMFEGREIQTYPLYAKEDYDVHTEKIEEKTEIQKIIDKLKNIFR